MREGWRGTGPRPTVRGGRFFHRSAGACPPRAQHRFFHRSAGACPPRALGCARDGEGQALALRCGVAFFFVARGLSPAIVAWRGTGPRPTVRVAFFYLQHGEGQALALRGYRGGKISFPFLMILCYNVCNGILPLPYREGLVGETSRSRCNTSRAFD